VAAVHLIIPDFPLSYKLQYYLIRSPLSYQATAPPSSCMLGAQTDYKKMIMCTSFITISPILSSLTYPVIRGYIFYLHHGRALGKSTRRPLITHTSSWSQILHPAYIHCYLPVLISGWVLKPSHGLISLCKTVFCITLAFQR
jgi:hypothetical protein